MTPTPQSLWSMYGKKSAQAKHDEYYVPMSAVPQNVKDWLKASLQAEPTENHNIAAEVQEGGQKIHIFFKKWQDGTLGLYWCDAEVWKTKEQEKAARQQSGGGGGGGNKKQGYYKEKNPKFAILESEQIALMEQGWKLKEKDVRVMKDTGEVELKNLYVQFEFVKFGEQQQQGQSTGAQQ